MTDNYNSVTDTSSYWSAWTDSDLRNWLIANGYLKSEAQATRDQLLADAQKYGNDLAETGRSYASWSDSKLKEYLSATGLNKTPTTREGLMREMRARYVPQKGYLDQIKDGVRDFIAGSHDVAGKVQQGGGAASISASSAASAASNSASSANARVHSEL